jgi:hypothetical protein
MPAIETLETEEFDRRAVSADTTTYSRSGYQHSCQKDVLAEWVSCIHLTVVAIAIIIAGYSMHTRVDEFDW